MKQKPLVGRARFKPLIVGELNPYGGDPRHALYPWPANSTGDRLCRKVMELSRSEYVNGFDRVNLCEGKWDAYQAKARVALIIADYPGATIVLLGAKVCRAFQVEYVPFTEVRLYVEHKVVILPHPSGLCRIWNEVGSYDRARKVLRKAGILQKKL